MKLKQIIKNILPQYILDRKEDFFKLISYLFLDKEGLKGLRCKTRKEMIASIPKGSKVLEIGPFFCPLIENNGEYNIKYFDVLDTKQLHIRAVEWGVATDKVPTKIDYVSPNGDLTIIDEKFDYVISSHNIEHHPDLIKHLKIIESLLVDGGKFIAIVPDKRLAYDYFLNISSIADIIDAHINKATKHSLTNIINHKLIQADPNPVKHFFGIHGTKPNLSDQKEELVNVVNEYLNSDKYIDVHAWIFTPRSFKDNIETLNKLGYINLEMKELTIPIFNSFEFAAVLKKK